MGTPLVVRRALAEALAQHVGARHRDGAVLELLIDELATPASGLKPAFTRAKLTRAIDDCVARGQLELFVVSGRIFVRPAAGTEDK